MKYAIVILDGGADFGIEDLGGRTPLEAARTPMMDAVATLGRLGTAATTPAGFAASSDVCSMSLLGYDPARYHTGRAPLEAASLGINAGPSDWIFRLNLVTVGETGTADQGLMLDHSAGAVSDAEARQLMAGLVEFWHQRAPALAAKYTLTHGVSYRGILVDSTGRAYEDLITSPPHEIPRQPWAAHVPRPRHANKISSPIKVADDLLVLMDLAAEYLPDHPINQARRSAGKRPGNMAWVWGQGRKPVLPSFKEVYGLSGAMITAVDLLSGIARLIGWKRLDVPGVTSYHDTDYAAQGRATCDAFDEFDVVCCHVESPDECSHQGDFKTKIAALEAIDAKVVGPILNHLKRYGDPATDPKAEGWRMLIMPDHYTLCSTRKHDSTPAPFAMAGSFVHAHRTAPYTEANANESDLHIEHGHELMEFFLRGGRAHVH